MHHGDLRGRRRLSCWLIAGVAFALVLSVDDARADLTSSTKDIVKCQKSVASEGVKLLVLQQKILEKCYEPLLTCTVMDVRGEFKSPEAKAKCFDKAAGACAKSFAKIAVAKDKRQAKLAKQCGAVTIADVQAANGLGYGFLPCGATTTTPSFLSCLDQLLQPKTEIVTGQLAARIGKLLDDRGLGGAFPDLPRP